MRLQTCPPSGAKNLKRQLDPHLSLQAPPRHALPQHIQKEPAPGSEDPCGAV